MCFSLSLSYARLLDELHTERSDAETRCSQLQPAGKLLEIETRAELDRLTELSDGKLGASTSHRGDGKLGVSAP